MVVDKVVSACREATIKPLSEAICASFPVPAFPQVIRSLAVSLISRTYRTRLFSITRDGRLWF